MPTRLTLIFALLLTHAAAQPAAPLQYANKTYKTAKIGTQTWLAENLNYEAEGSVCYENNPANCAKYGRLYNWETAMKVCPKGWHLPSSDEWDILLRYVKSSSGTSSYDSLIFHKPANEGGQYLKAKSGWSKGNGEDQHGFSALPGGYGSSDGNFYGVGNYSHWWNTTIKDSTFHPDIFYNDVGMIFHYFDKSWLLSVRCLQD